MTFIAGPYLWHWGAATPGGSPLSLGTLAEAPLLSYQDNTVDITADYWGGQAIDGIYQGKTGTLEMICQEWDAPGVQAALKSFSGTLDGIGSMNLLGCPIVSSVSDVLYAQLIDNATGTCGTPAQFVAYRAALEPNNQVSFTLGLTLRQVPLRFTLYPYERGGTQGFPNFHVFEFNDTTSIPTRAQACELPAYITNTCPAVP